MENAFPQKRMTVLRWPFHTTAVTHKGAQKGSPATKRMTVPPFSVTLARPKNCGVPSRGNCNEFPVII